VKDHKFAVGDEGNSEAVAVARTDASIDARAVAGSEAGIGARAVASVEARRVARIEAGKALDPVAGAAVSAESP
jgi:hypothetical protein